MREKAIELVDSILSCAPRDQIIRAASELFDVWPECDMLVVAALIFARSLALTEAELDSAIAALEEIVADVE